MPRWQPLANHMESSLSRRLLVQHNASAPTTLWTYVVFAPEDTTLAEAVRVAGIRWVFEELFETAKGEVVLENYEM